MEESMFCDENGKPFPRTNKFDMELYNKKLEEQAEENRKSLNMSIGLDRYIAKKDACKDYEQHTTSFIFADGYTEGFEEGRKEVREHAIEWHDLRKNPEDLPKEKELVLLLICASVRVIGWYDNNKFIMDVNGRMFDKEDIIAWCELPQFKE